MKIQSSKRVLALSIFLSLPSVVAGVVYSRSFQQNQRLPGLPW